jgi:hypothetical protein
VNIFNGIVNLFRFDKTNWRAVALCLVAATVFWFFNALNKEHTATISFPIEFQFNQSAFIPVRALPQNVLINITGSGWDLLRKSVGFKAQPLMVVLDRPVETKKLPPASMLALASTQFGQLKINHIASDTLMVSIDRRKTKRVRLFAASDRLKFAPGFGLSSEISVSPDSVLLEGPLSVLNQIPDSVQVELPIESIDDNVNADGEIILPVQDAVTINIETASVRFNVARLIEQSKKIKLVVFPSPPYRHQLFNDSVSVRFRIPSTLKDSLKNNGGLFAVIKLQDLEYGTTRIPPAIKGTIPFAEIIRVDSIMIRKY